MLTIGSKSTPNSAQLGSLDIEMVLLEYSTGRPHPRVKNSTISVMTSLVHPSLMCKIVGDNLVLILDFMHIWRGEAYIFIWDWRTNVLKVVSQPSAISKIILHSCLLGFLSPL
jgi:hypothetical protein